MELQVADKQNLFKEINSKSDHIMKYALIGYFIVGLFLATFYDTYLIALGVGGLSLLAYFLTKAILPTALVHHYVCSIVLGIFAAQYIYQMHGLFEMHFIFFVGSTLLITYQNWKLQIPLIVFVVVHHATFAYLQYTGMKEIYFTQLDYMDLQTFLFHAAIAAIIVFICGYWAYDLEKITIRERTIIRESEKQFKNIKNNIKFAEEISKGNLKAAFGDEENDELGKSLLKMKESLLEATDREQEEKFITTGIATVGEILRKHTNDTKALSEDLIRTMVKYLDANQGSLFLVESSENEKYLTLTACYAYDRKKFVENRIEIGQGLVGQCFVEQETIYMTNVPNDYVKITSGLGMANPSSVILIPLISNEEVTGVLELASFRKFSEKELAFLKKASESIASAVISTRTTERIKILLEDSQQRSEEMRAQEEEMRQNMEELSATQEEMQRVLNEVQVSERYLDELLNASQDSIFAMDKDYRVIRYNKVFEESVSRTGVTVQKGIDALQFYKGEEKNKMKKLYDRAFNGEQIEMTHRFAGDGITNDFIMNYVPLKDGQGNISAIAVYAKNLTLLAKKMEKEGMIN